MSCFMIKNAPKTLILSITLLLILGVKETRGSCPFVATSYTLPSSYSYPLAIAFSPNGLYVATANDIDPSNVTLFKLVCPSPAVSYSLPSGSQEPDSVAFSQDGLYLATANYNSSDVTIFKVNPNSTNTSLVLGTSFPLPNGSLQPKSITFSYDNSYVATANSNSNDVSLFKFVSGQLTGGISYALPTNSTHITGQKYKKS